MSTEGLRERKKAATRAALSAAALRLTMERGLDRLRVEDIAAEAGVSPRTFNNYFSRKEEAVVGNAAAQADRIAAVLRARPRDEPLWESLRHAVIEAYGEPDREAVATVRLIKEELSLRAEFVKADLLGQRVLAREIAVRTGADAGRDLHPRLAAATVVAVVHTALDHWLDSPSGTTFAGTLSAAFDLVTL
ncbi:MAG TPA: TetR family transcriptional regulator [Candidatus Limnocylindrales bacterium]|nr:TetR family transcriptional regulator [Candidatus Limnocylindrales bacterium]